MNKLVNTSDKLAIGLSFMCVLHCIALPIILVFLPTVTGLLALNDERLHLWLVFAVIPISLFAVISGYLHHKRSGVLLVSAVGLAMLVSAVTLGHDALGETGEVIFTLLGSGLVAFGHIFNIKLRKAQAYNSPIELNS
ncbi:MAG: carbon starvation protein CstA [Glaciecola sp.]